MSAARFISASLLFAFLTVAAARIPFAEAAAVSPATSDSSRISIEEPEVSTGADFTWTATILVHNGLEAGLYLDSLFCDVEDQDPGETRASRKTRLDLRSLTKISPPIPGLETGVIQHTGPSLAERAQLTYTMHGHRSTGGSLTLRTSVQAVPGGSAAYPSKSLDVGGKKVEVVIVPALSDTGAGPGVFVIHGHGNHARHNLRFARQLAVRGYAVGLVSMPGYGESQGPADFMGPATMAAAEAALEEFRKSGRVDPKRIVVWGQSRGATVAAKLAARYPDLRGVILQSGFYDLWATYRGTRVDELKQAIVAEAGKDSAAWRDRSPTLIADKLKSPALVIHGELDDQAPVDQARGMAHRIQASGGRVETQFVARSGSVVPQNQVLTSGFGFLSKNLAR